MGLDELVEPSDGNTPIAAEELEALIPSLSSQQDLNEWEMTNIIRAEGWCFGRALRLENPFTDDYVRKLHKKMFGDTWKWAGKYRNTEKNLGVPVYQIREKLKALLDDAQYWRDNKTYDLDELAMRFHHRLVSIHPFPNGNGRHARLMADVIATISGSERYRWGRQSITSVGNVRTEYINALKEADAGNIMPLIKFAR